MLDDEMVDDMVMVNYEMIIPTFMEHIPTPIHIHNLKKIGKMDDDMINTSYFI